MKSLLLTLASLSIALSPVAHVMAADTNEKALTDVERLQKNAKELSPEQLNDLATTSLKSVEFFEKAVRDTQISLDNKMEIQGYYVVNLRMLPYAKVLFGISMFSALASSTHLIQTSAFMQQVFTDALRNAKASGFQGPLEPLIQEAQQKSLRMKVSENLGKLGAHAKPILAMSLVTTALSGAAMNYALTEKAKLNESDIRTLEAALARLSFQLNEQRNVARFFQQQAELKGKYQFPQVGLFPGKQAQQQ